MNENGPKFYNDDGTEINPDLIPKPALCVTCRRDEFSGKEEILCTLTRSDQQGEPEFRCDAYEPKEEQSST
jgi:hypothetical protein